MGYTRGGSTEQPAAVEAVGSDSLLTRSLSIGPSDYPVTIGFAANNVLAKNDGGADLYLNLAGGKAAPITAPYTDTANWTFTGTWSVFAGPPAANYSNTVGDHAVFNPGVTGLDQLVVGLLVGQGVGIAQIELSSDGGATWVNPSTIANLVRSDGATGTAMDTWDGYDGSTSAALSSLTFDMQYVSTDAWAVRISPTGTKNASATGTYVFVASCDAYYNGAFVIKSGESLSLDYRTSSVTLACPDTASTNAVRVAFT